MLVVFMVAGMSSRFGGKLKQLAKVGINGETLIEVSVNEALDAPFSKIIFITNELTEHYFIDIFRDEYKGIPVSYVRQHWDKETRDRPWGTTSAACSLKGIIKEPFIIVNSDDLYGKQTFKRGYDLLHSSQNNIIGGCLLEKTMPADEEQIVNRGVIEVNKETGVVDSIEEMLNISTQRNPELLTKLASVNFIGLRPETLNYLQAILEDFKFEHQKDRKIECLLPSDLNYLIQNNLITMNYFQIENAIHGITYPGDEKHMKLVVSLYNK